LKIDLLGDTKQYYLNELRQTGSYHFCASDVELTDVVSVYGAVVAMEGSTVSVGDYVAYSDSEHDKVCHLTLPN